MKDLGEIKILLHQYLIDNKIFGNYKYGGSGSHGHVFFLNDIVVKITEDREELSTAQYFQYNKHQSIVEYHQIDFINKIGFIRMEYVTPLDIRENNLLIKYWHEMINPNSLKVFGFEIEQYRNDILELRNQFNIDIKELHWSNCGFNLDGKLKFFDLRFI